MNELIFYFIINRRSAIQPESMSASWWCFYCYGLYSVVPPYHCHEMCLTVRPGFSCSVSQRLFQAPTSRARVSLLFLETAQRILRAQPLSGKQTPLNGLRTINHWLGPIASSSPRTRALLPSSAYRRTMLGTTNASWRIKSARKPASTRWQSAVCLLHGVLNICTFNVWNEITDDRNKVKSS